MSRMTKGMSGMNRMAKGMENQSRDKNRHGQNDKRNDWNEQNDKRNDKISHVIKTGMDGMGKGMDWTAHMTKGMDTRHVTLRRDHVTYTWRIKEPIRKQQRAVYKLAEYWRRGSLFLF